MDVSVMAILVFVLDLSSLSFRIVDFGIGIGGMQHCNLEVAVLVVKKDLVVVDDYVVVEEVEDSSAAAAELDKIVEEELLLVDDNLLAADSSFEMAVEEACPVLAELFQ